MDERRKRAYRYLLYYAMLDIRPIAWIRFSFLQVLNPFSWQHLKNRARMAGSVADCFHNLALFSALDFVRFDEDWFWRGMENSRRPKIDVALYRARFEQKLNEPVRPS